MSEEKQNEEQKAELPSEELENVAGGLSFNFGLVSVKTISWDHDDPPPPPPPPPK